MALGGPLVLQAFSPVCVREVFPLFAAPTPEYREQEDRHCVAIRMFSLEILTCPSWNFFGMSGTTPVD
jgi:hypothetical protein